MDDVRPLYRQMRAQLLADLRDLGVRDEDRTAFLQRYETTMAEVLAAFMPERDAKQVALEFVRAVEADTRLN